jgi:hypothetical protein
MHLRQQTKIKIITVQRHLLLVTVSRTTVGIPAKSQRTNQGSGERGNLYVDATVRIATRIQMFDRWVAVNGKLAGP